MAVMSEFVAVFGRLHPILLHLPMGLLIGLAVLEAHAVWKRQGVSPRLLVFLAAGTAVLTASAGLVLHDEPSYAESDILEWHERLGIATALTTCLAAFFHSRGAVKNYRLSLLVAVLVMMPAGHFGGTMTHGAGFLLEPLEEGFSDQNGEGPSVPDPPLAEAAPIANYADHIAPILKARCVNCHGQRKQKGDLRLDTPEWILKGGESGDALVAGNVEDSEIIFRLHLPLDDEDRMPPEHKRQPSEGQVQLLEAWIASGASFDDEFTLMGGLTLPEDQPAPEEEGLLPASEKALAALRAKQVHVQRISGETEQLWVDFAAPAADIGDSEVKKLLAPLEDHVADLSLARTQISDKAMGRVADLIRLRRLDLRQTALTDVGLARLAENPTLEELNIAGTGVTDGSIPLLLALPALTHLWVWESQLSAEGIAQLRTERPELKVNAGDSADAVALEVEGDVEFTSDAPSVDAPPEEGLPISLVPSNDTCPITEKPVDPKYTIVFEGKVIGFCCPNCPKTFWEKN
jgi:uncharacterized membrane protein